VPPLKRPLKKPERESHPDRASTAPVSEHEVHSLSTELDGGPF
jgi:hypothetical protein